ncbi:hypothetical protein SK128_011674, partial [Halocaridina rubra]
TSTERNFYYEGTYKQRSFSPGRIFTMKDFFHPGTFIGTSITTMTSIPSNFYYDANSQATGVTHKANITVERELESKFDVPNTTGLESEVSISYVTTLPSSLIDEGNYLETDTVYKTTPFRDKFTAPSSTEVSNSEYFNEDPSSTIKYDSETQRTHYASETKYAGTSRESSEIFMEYNPYYRKPFTYVNFYYIGTHAKSELPNLPSTDAIVNSENVPGTHEPNRYFPNSAELMIDTKYFTRPYTAVNFYYNSQTKSPQAADSAN